MVEVCGTFSRGVVRIVLVAGVLAAWAAPAAAKDPDCDSDKKSCVTTIIDANDGGVTGPGKLKDHRLKTKNGDLKWTLLHPTGTSLTVSFSGFQDVASGAAACPVTKVKNGGFDATSCTVTAELSGSSPVALVVTTDKNTYSGKVFKFTLTIKSALSEYKIDPELEIDGNRFTVLVISLIALVVAALVGVVYFLVGRRGRQP